MRHLLIEDFLEADLCDRLCGKFRYLSKTVVNHIPGFWDGRFLWHSDIAQVDPDLAAQMLAAQRRAIAVVTGFYRPSRTLYPDLLQIMSWPVGFEMPPHADNANPDGSPHEMAHRDFSAVIYLNDDYRGGEFRFTRLDLTIRPRKGMLLAFTAGLYHEHAVLRVEGRERLTMPFFMTFDRMRADAALI